MKMKCFHYPQSFTLRKQRVILNGQSSFWVNVNAGVPQRSTLGPVPFLIYINDLSDGLSSKAKLLANDTYLFSVVHDIDTSAIESNSDLKKKIKKLGLLMENEFQSRSSDASS